MPPADLKEGIVLLPSLQPHLYNLFTIHHFGVD
jgi:hypothetical protein